MGFVAQLKWDANNQNPTRLTWWEAICKHGDPVLTLHIHRACKVSAFKYDVA